MKDSPVALDHFIQSGTDTEAEIELTYNGMDTRIKIRRNTLV